MEQTSHLLVQLADLLLEELQLLHRHLQEPSVHGLELRARTERITQHLRATPEQLQGRGLSPLPPGEDNDAQLFAQSRTLRIRQSNGLTFSNVRSTSPLRTGLR
jgi:hypothetical protein